MQLGHSRVQAGELAVVRARVAVVAAQADGIRQSVVVGGDQTTLAGHHHLRGAEAEHLRGAEAADRPACARRPERVRRIEDEWDAESVREPLE
jgi:hypothetical protein